ncbi:hypothetical protein HPY08_06555 [Vibrio cholerae]|uniref:hypothetical protein n=1 Tax=Vibrio cholerae TaxID=666 RepID=UPI001581B2BF|nr:hypothetical protein [Vibrio cholerae]QKU78598.1 hypothetical protein HPY08_06555 [Vibrio cholerae]
MNSKPFIIITAIFIPLILFLISPVYSSLFGSEKSLSYALVHTKDLTEDYKEGDSWSKLSTSFDGEELNSAYLSRIMIINSGNVPISRDDFDSDVTIKMGADIGILGIRIEESSPFNLGVEYYFNEDEINFKGLLLNPNDSFVIETLSKGRPTDIAVQSRISGIDRPRQMDYQKSDGIYLKRVRHESLVMSNEKSLMKLNPYLLGVISLFSTFVTLINIRFTKVKNVIFNFSLIAPYFLSLFVLLIMIDIILDDIGLESSILRTGVFVLLSIVLIVSSKLVKLEVTRS